MSNFFGRSDFNVGQDISVTITTSQGDTFSAEELGHLVDIDVDNEREMVRVKPCSNGGKVLRMGIPQGVKGKLTFARINSQLDKLRINADQLWYTSKIETTVSFQFLIQNRDGTTDSYMIQNASIGSGKMFGGKADKEVDQDLAFEAAQMTQT